MRGKGGVTSSCQVLKSSDESPPAIFSLLSAHMSSKDVPGALGVSGSRLKRGPSGPWGEPRHSDATAHTWATFLHASSDSGESDTDGCWGEADLKDGDVPRNHGWLAINCDWNEIRSCGRAVVGLLDSLRVQRKASPQARCTWVIQAVCCSDVRLPAVISTHNATL